MTGATPASASLAQPRAVSASRPPAPRSIRSSVIASSQVQLFRRKPRGVELIQAGESFLVEARTILDRVEHAASAARRTARGEAGRIGLGFTSSALFHPFVPRVIRAFREAYPLVALSLEE